MLNGSKNEYPSVTFTSECNQNPQLFLSIAASSLFLLFLFCFLNPWMAWHGHMCQTSKGGMMYKNGFTSILEKFNYDKKLIKKKKSIKLVVKARFHPVTINAVRWKAWNEWYDAKHKIYTWWGHLSWIQAFPCKFRHANCPMRSTLMFYFL